MPYYLKIINVFLLATIRYFYTPLAAFLLKLGLVETMITMVAGGIASFLFFYYLTNILAGASKYLKPHFVKITPNSWLRKYEQKKLERTEKRKLRPKFTRRNKIIVKMRRHYGFWGIVVVTPIVLSIPFGAILMHKYYKYKKGSILYSLLAIAIEGVIICLLFWLIPALRN